MHRPGILGNGLKRLASAPRSRRSFATVTDADVESARRYCLKQLQTSDYDAHLIHRFIPPPVQDTYAALRALNLELVRLPELVSNPTIGVMRMKFWQESIDKTFAGQPPREPICILLHRGLQQLELRAGSSSTAKSIKFWVSRLIRTRERHMDNRPFATLASLEGYAEHTYSTIMYATLASMPLRSMHVDHLASHIGKACGIVAVLRGIPILAAPAQPVRSPSGLDTPSRTQAILLPLDIMAEEGVKEEEVFRQGPNAPGLQDAIFKVATRANDHLITAREMLKRLKAGQDPGHEFEHQGEGEHQYFEEGDNDTARDIRRGFGALLEAVPAAQWLLSLEKANFDPFATVDAVAKMLYELIAIVRPGSLTEVKEIAQTVGSLVLKNGGVIRGLSNWGVFSLPKPISIHQMKHTHGHYFVMRYDSSTKVHQDVRSTLRLEPRMIRAAHVKLGDGKLETVSRFGPPKWRTQGSEA
ncbi:phytoene synthetase/ ribosomal protein S6 [Trichoderma atroviride IMI 206040]|uniref:Small ribosomal subunit protein bS6m n=1 Tax=Hypocrea atroviridis (strain ATCC 20476 / IMI 206040) TaxID=452589 RepID=G9NRR6_HYPAI|nr:phytoene synthetase/ ribosomal protein S6 [Trichoderma atroviride IMI 206040]EHK46698.1 phytoene synthetase/ ribosomal protein S6 [Trichoderma atroviride IMI 206040]